MKVFIRTHRLLPLATFVLLAVLVAVTLGSPLVQVQWGGTNGVRFTLGGLGSQALAAGTWTSQTSGTSNSLNGTACPSASNCFAVGAGGTIVATTNGGSTSWTSQTSGISNLLNGIACLSATNCYVVGAYVNGGGKVQVLNTTNGGSTWASQNTNISTFNSLSSIACPGTSPITCFAVGASGGIIKTSNGSSWSQLTSGTTNSLSSIACLSTTNCFVVGAGGTILKTTDGSTWTSLTSGTTNSLSSIACLSTTTCFAVGAGGTILKTTNGSSWSSLTSGTTNGLNGIACPATNTCFAVGASGTILNTTDGSSWSSQSSGTTNSLNGIACPNTNNCFAVGASGKILNNAGSLTESGATASTATPVTLNGANHTTTYTLMLTVVDSRGSGAGWNLAITSTTFTAGSHVLSTAASKINTAPTPACVGSCTLPTTTGITYPFMIPAGTTPPTAQKYFNAASGTGMGTMTITATVTIAIPANTFNGSYTSTLSIAIVSGP